MAKELPYFKFEPSEWDNGNIQMCSRESKGLFTDLCSLYWSRLGELPHALALQKLCNGNKDAMQELLQHEIFGVIDGQIVIEFLDEQLQDRGQTSEKRREAAQKRWSDASALQMQSKSNANRIEENREEEKKKEENTNESVIEIKIDKWPFENFWEAYGKKQDRAKCEKKWANLKDEEHEAIMGHVPKYVMSTPDIQFRKHPATYLNNRSWENEIIYHSKQNGSGKIGTKQQQTINTAIAVAEHYSDILGKRPG